MREDRADIALTFSYPGRPRRSARLERPRALGARDRQRRAARRAARRASRRDPTIASTSRCSPARTGSPAARAAAATCSSCARAPASSRTSRFETDNFVAVEGLVAQGIGVATLPRMAVASFPQLPGRRHAARCRPPRRGRIHVVTAHGADRVPAVRATLDALARVLHCRGGGSRRHGGARRRRTKLDDDVCHPIPAPRPPPAPTCACASARRPPVLPHVGLIRTALFNWAYARHTGGKLVFRIEDTDAARDSEESYVQLLDALRWLRIDWDEGVEVGGPHAPYRQSQRHDIYREVLAQADRGRARLRELLDRRGDRRPQRGERPRRSSSATTTSTATSPTSRGRRSAPRAASPRWRLRVPDEDLTFVDLIRGEVDLPRRIVPRLRARAGRRRPAVHVREPGRRRAHGHHARAARRGPHALDRRASSRSTARSSTSA